MTINTKDPRVRIPVGFLLIVVGYIGLLFLSVVMV